MLASIGSLLLLLPRHFDNTYKHARKYNFMFFTLHFLYSTVIFTCTKYSFDITLQNNSSDFFVSSHKVHTLLHLTIEEWIIGQIEMDEFNCIINWITLITINTKNSWMITLLYIPIANYHYYLVYIMWHWANHIIIY